MSDEYEVGSVGWLDLTVEDAGAVKEFYENVVGWSSSGVEMKGYDDFVMLTPGGQAPVGGVCHARGPNQDIPPFWIVYFMVANLDDSIASVESGGGAVVSGPRSMGTTGRYCIIRDPAGAYAGLFQSLTTDETDPGE